MKKVMLGLIFLGITNLMNSQNEIASVDIKLDDYIMPSKSNPINSNYYASFESKITSGRVRNFQNVVANYDIKKSSDYSNTSSSNYTVVFEEGENQITANYNSDGKIVECNEVFKNIKLPYAISSNIAKKFPGWEFNEISCQINYKSSSKESVIYKVNLQKGNKKKTLKLNTNDYNL